MRLFLLLFEWQSLLNQFLFRFWRLMARSLFLSTAKFGVFGLGEEESTCPMVSSMNRYYTLCVPRKLLAHQSLLSIIVLMQQYKQVSVGDYRIFRFLVRRLFLVSFTKDLDQVVNYFVVVPTELFCESRALLF